MKNLIYHQSVRSQNCVLTVKHTLLLKSSHIYHVYEINYVHVTFWTSL